MVSEVLIDAEGINLIDTTGAEMLLELQKELSRKNITLSFARVHDAVKDRMQTTGVVDLVGSDQFYETLQEGMDAFIGK